MGEEREKNAKRMQKLCSLGMKAKERETTTPIRKLDRDLGNILISSLIGNAGRGE